MSHPAKYFSELIISGLQSVVGNRKVALHEPSFTGNEWLYVKECLDSTYVSSVGKFVTRFESDLTSYTGAKHAVAVVNGTAGLHLALLLAGVGHNDEVLMPALTFVATANAVSYCSAMPHLVDCNPENLGFFVEKTREYLSDTTEQRAGQCINKTTGRVIRAMVPMHTFGHPVDIEGCLRLAKDFNVQFVEDAAESLGSLYDGKHTGTFGQSGVLSFNGNKIVTTGGGGAILTNDEKLAKKAKHLSTTAKLPHAWHYVHDECGYNYRMPNINAALGCAQLENLPEFIAKKRNLFNKYYNCFKDKAGVSLVHEPEKSRSNYWLQTLELDIADEKEQNKILYAVNEAGFMVRPPWKLMNTLQPYRNVPAMNLDEAKRLATTLVNLPSSQGLLG